MEKATVTARWSELFLYDDGVLRNKTQRRRAKAGEIAGTTKDNDGYLVVKVCGRVHKVHRIIFSLHHGWEPPQVDHVDGVRDNNRIENLRAATATENAYNKKRHATNRVGIKGVTRMGRKWMAQCQVRGKRHYLGLFESPELAGAALASFRLQHHQQFANNG